MSRFTSKQLSRAWITVLVGVLVSGCGSSRAKQERVSRLAKVRRIAVVAFVGKSSVSPKADVWKPFTADALKAFQKASQEASPVVEFIPVQSVVEDRVFQSVAKTSAPDDGYSPVDGLTYIRQENDKAFDCTRLAESLGVDAVLMVLVDFAAEVRDEGSTFLLTAKTTAELVGAPNYRLWNATPNYEEEIKATIVSHPKLVGSIGAKWIVMARPSAGEYAALMQIAADSHTTMPERVGNSLVSELVEDIKKAQGHASRGKG